VPSLKAEIAGREIKFLVVERIVGDVHLAVDAAERAIRVEDCGCVVIETGGTLLEERRDQHNLIFKGGSGKFFSGRSRDRLCQIKEGSVLALAKILRLE
jgi:hypothetical protein